MSEDKIAIPKAFAEEMNEVFNQKDNSGIVEGIKQLFSPDDIQMKSDFKESVNESAYFTKLLILSDVCFDNKQNVLKSYAMTEIKNRVSNDRKSRGEVVTMAQNTPMKEERKGGFLGRMFG